MGKQVMISNEVTRILDSKREHGESYSSIIADLLKHSGDIKAMRLLENLKEFRMLAGEYMLYDWNDFMDELIHIVLIVYKHRGLTPEEWMWFQQHFKELCKKDVLDVIETQRKLEFETEKDRRADYLMRHSSELKHL